MKRKSISGTKPAGSRTFIGINGTKIICALWLALFSLTAGITKAQVWTLSGRGMSICSTFVYTSSTHNQIISPLNYGNQFYACSGANDNDISFNIPGTTWRVQWLSWIFTPTTTAGATLDGYDVNNSPITTVNMNSGDALMPVGYPTISGIDCVKFQINGTGPVLGPYRRGTWYITAP